MPIDMPKKLSNSPLNSVERATACRYYSEDEILLLSKEEHTWQNLIVLKCAISSEPRRL